MAEYIERAEVLELMRSVSRDIEDVPENAFPEDYADGWKDGLETVADKVESLFAADVRPERHGEWNELSLDDQDEGMYICSKCKSIEFMPEECDIYAYCPNCGAKMDGKDV